MVSRTYKSTPASLSVASPGNSKEQATISGALPASGAAHSVTSRRVQGRTKVQELSDRLENLARRLGPGAQLPKVVELCRDFGVSKMTLQGAMEALEEQGILQRRHGVGIFVSTPSQPSTRRIMLLCDALLVQSPTQSDFWKALLSHLRRRSAEENEQLLLHFSPPGDVLRAKLEEWHDSLAELLDNGQYDGVLGVHTPAWPGIPLFELGIPVVQYAGYAPYMVETDWNGAASLATKALWDRGCRKIGIWSGAMPHQAFSGILLAEWREQYHILEAQGTPVEPSLIENNLPLEEGGYPVLMTQQEQGYETAKRVFSRPRAQWPDGVYIAEDTTTRGALLAFNEMGIEIGRDVLLASHLNRGSDALQGYQSRVIIIEFDPSEIVSEMFNLLESLMNGEEPANNIVVVPAKLVTHETS